MTLRITETDEVCGIEFRTPVGNPRRRNDIMDTLVTGMSQLYKNAYGIGCNIRTHGKYYYGVRNEYSGGIPIELVSSGRDYPGIDRWLLIIRTDIDSTISVTPGYDCVVAACGDLTIDELNQLAWLDVV